jgi:glutamyl-tRNA synthetase
MDDTPMEEMREERGNRVASKHRTQSPADGLSIFEKLLKGDVSVAAWCLRAKIDMSSDNGTLRDPVLYRGNATPHHRTGTKFHAYPTYDFVCPIVDSVEGVTHCLRTLEYADRDAQYHILQDMLKLRKVRAQSPKRARRFASLLTFLRAFAAGYDLRLFEAQLRLHGALEAEAAVVRGQRQGAGLERP